MAGLSKLLAEAALAEGRTAGKTAALKAALRKTAKVKGDPFKELEDVLGGPSSALPSASGTKTFHHGISKTKLEKPLEEMQATYRNVADLVPSRPISPEILQGTTLIPAYGDRTIAGRELTSVGGGPQFENPVLLDGGPNFMRGPQQQADMAAWAAKRGALSTIAKRASAHAERTPVNMVYTSMGERSSDFATKTAKALLEQMKFAPVTAGSKAAFDTHMRTLVPSFPGIDSISPEWLRKSGASRVKMVEEMAKSRWRKLGFPDVAETRFALTEPALLNRKGSVAGFNVATLPGGELITKPKVPHTTYDTQLKGAYLGSLPPIPRNVMFPKWASSLKPGVSETAANRSFLMSDVSQFADAKWLEGVMNYLRSPEGQKYGIGGAIAAGLLTLDQAKALFSRGGQQDA